MFFLAPNDDWFLVNIMHDLSNRTSPRIDRNSDGSKPQRFLLLYLWLELLLSQLGIHLRSPCGLQEIGKYNLVIKVTDYELEKEGG
jgi:hypothetical protein